MNLPIDFLKKYWNHNSFRKKQEAIIQNVLERKDTFVLLPTGGGKSICFQIPALMMPGICIVISPLIALMEDQVQNLKQRGIKALAIYGSVGMEETHRLLDNCMYGEYKFLYIAPERLQQFWFLSRLAQLTVNLVAIDEAHCVSQWGHDFRPSYLQLYKLKEHFPNQPFIALTASANNKTQHDIITLLKLETPNTFKDSFYRENLYYGVYHIEDKENTLFKILKKNQAPTIIYARNRKECHFFSDQLNQLGFPSTFFHGGLSTHEKKKRLQSWLEEEIPIIVATNAFGMGIDKDNVKNVIHIQIPENIENYYQEAGRAGRNGAKAFTTILVSPNDIHTFKKWHENSLLDQKFLSVVYRKLNNFLNIAYGEGYHTEHSFNFNTFCKRYKFPLKKTYGILEFLDRQGVIGFSQNFGQKSKIQFLVTTSLLLDHVSDNERAENLLLFLVRNYPGLHDFKIEVQLDLIADQLNEELNYIESTLQQWHDLEICQFEAENNDISVLFFETREDDLTLNRTLKYLKQQNELKTKQFKAMLGYIQNLDICKNKIILHYFDEDFSTNCGTCSTCIRKKNNNLNWDLKTISVAIGKELQRFPLHFEEIQQQLQYDKEALHTALQILLEEDKIILNDKNQFTIK